MKQRPIYTPKEAVMKRAQILTLVLALSPGLAFGQYATKGDCAQVVSATGETMQQKLDKTLELAIEEFSPGVLREQAKTSKAHFDVLCQIDAVLGMHEAKTFITEELARAQRIGGAMQQIMDAEKANQQ